MNDNYKLQLTIEASKKIKNLMVSAYDDYIAARVLLNKGYIIQGATLSSLAIEKYFKASLTGFGISYRKIHMDRLSDIKTLFTNTTHEDLFTILDDVFLQLLQRAYKFRYYDGLTEPTTVGFLINQFTAELDYTVYLFEQLITLDDGNMIWKTPFQRAKDERNADLLENNFLASGIDKKEYMQKESDAYLLTYNSRTQTAVVITSNKKLKFPYQNQMMILDVNWSPKHQV